MAWFVFHIEDEQTETLLELFESYEEAKEYYEANKRNYPYRMYELRDEDAVVRRSGLKMNPRRSV